jgi:omega-amidase
MKVAAAQISCILGDLKSNLEKMDDFASRARQAGAELIVFPETADTGYAMSIIQAQATSGNDGVIPKLQQIAQAHSIALISGIAEREGARIYNTQIVIDASGKLVARYRKAHLFTAARIGEDKCFTPGDEFTSFSMGGFRFGLSICYDLRFPEVYRTLAVRDAVNVFAISSAWPFPRAEHFRTLAVARAIENQSYVVSSNRVGMDDGIPFCGMSAIIDPYGVVIASGSADREELVSAELSEEVLQSVRKRMTIFDHRRPELYQSHC